MSLKSRAANLVTWVAVLLTAASASAGPKVDVVIGPEAPPLVRFAADELAGQWKRLFEAEVTIAEAAPDGAENLVLLGDPATNPALKELAGDIWPELTDQGIVLRSVDRPGSDKKALVIGGGSPVATLWGVYEVGHRLGVRYLLSGDFYPPEPPPFSLAVYDVLLEPSFKTRACRLLDGGPTGNESWGLADQERLLSQLAKLKFNRVILVFAPDGPWIDFEFGGVKKSTAQLFGGQKFDVSGDTPGRRAFKGAKEFTNPDFAGKTTYEELTAAGRALARGIIDKAHGLGMSAGVQIEPLSFPREFGEVLPGSPEQTENGLVRVDVAGGFSSEMKRTIGAQPAACLGRYDVEALVLAGVKAPERDLVYRAIFDASLPGRTLECWFRDPDALEMVAPASRRMNELAALTRETVLPQADAGRMETAIAVARRKPTEGLVVTTRGTGETDTAAHYVSRAAFAEATTLDESSRDVWEAICGNADAAGRLRLGLDFLEQATIAAEAMNYGQPKPGQLLPGSVQGSVDRDQLKRALDLYIQSTNEMFRAHDNCHPAARKVIYYYCKRGEFAIHFLTACDAVAQAAEAKEKGDKAERTKQLETAIESLYSAATSMSEVARDQSDRGLIAVLAAYGYRPLQEMLAAEMAE